MHTCTKGADPCIHPIYWLDAVHNCEHCGSHMYMHAPGAASRAGHCTTVLYIFVPGSHGTHHASTA